MQLLLVALISGDSIQAGLAIASACDSTTITSQDDASDIKACSTITGDVTLSTSVTGAISLDGIEEIKGGLRSQASQFSSFSAPQLRTAEIDELQISGSGDLTLTFYTGYYKGVTGPKSIGVLNITGCAYFFPFHETTLVNTLNLYQNNFTALELDWLQVKDTISIMDNPNLSDIMFLSSIVVPDVASHGPPNGTEAPQWKELVIVGNPELDSAKIGFGGWEKSFW
ncbi:hypothetical protein SCAR479_09338 [Seiridium cardinale]|uniref:Uncharacterized protein n=1 Tax=Seiridium cardinale TaxID=138064 RepID=A0ABR2XJM7_9PEZI